MVDYRHSAHAVFDLKYHVVWTTKYRYKILRGDVAERARDLIRQICAAREVTIIRGAVFTGSCPHAVGSAAAVGPVQTGAVLEGPVVPDAAGGVPGAAETVLGPTPVGAGGISVRAWARWTRR